MKIHEKFYKKIIGGTQESQSQAKLHVVLCLSFMTTCL